MLFIGQRRGALRSRCHRRPRDDLHL